ncbi:hypothetical protein O1611_g3391 [Lasiodiplodia mahajangana]|uniref:Uncharacterized protein n=1 Tax=Lasiodiplodia mahajangana TaxID=1108764 RepID=A0ACC2JRW8_9PEZI|nr:hypothetical protein O1611_g3391 [Lasiodiplodia mahajangana]
MDGPDPYGFGDEFIQFGGLENPNPNPAPARYPPGFAAQAALDEQQKLNVGLGNQLQAARNAIVRAVARELRTTFAHSRAWEFEKTLGNGSYGLTVLLRDRDPLNTRHRRRVVLKRSVTVELGDRDLINEMIFLKVLRGNAHIVQLIAATPDTGDFKKRRASLIRRAVGRIIGLFSIGWFRNPPQDVFGTLSISGGPALLLEFCENGDLVTLIDRAVTNELTLPNRLLWSFFLCLCRAAIGMAWPKEGDAGAPQEIEEIRRRDPRGIVHRDIAARNIVINTTENDVPEHALAPKLKLIDFGMARESGEGAAALSLNIIDLCAVMITLITRRHFRIEFGNPGLYNGIETYATGIIPPYIAGENPAPNLDPELRTLIVECMSINERRRPAIEVILRRVREGAEKNASTYVNSAQESDLAIKQLIDQLLHDA